MGNRSSQLSPLAFSKFKGTNPSDWKQAKQALALVTEGKPTTERSFETYGRVTRVIDGDTFIVALIMGTQIEIHRIRLAECDTPETRVTEQKKAGEEVKLYVTQLLTQYPFVKVSVQGKDKYGRTLARLILCDDERLGCFGITSSKPKLLFDLTNHLIKKGYAYSYKGGTKPDFNSWWKKGI